MKTLWFRQVGKKSDNRLYLKTVQVVLTSLSNIYSFNHIASLTASELFEFLSDFLDDGKKFDYTYFSRYWPHCYYRFKYGKERKKERPVLTIRVFKPKKKHVSTRWLITIGTETLNVYERVFKK